MSKATSLRLSRMGTAVQESATLRQNAHVAELRAAGRRIYNFTVGEPDCEAPEPVREAARRAIDAGDTHYTATAGTPDLRKAVAAHYAARHGIAWRPAQTIVSAGAKQVIWNALAACLGPGDEVVLLAPYWTSYAAFVRILGGAVRVVRPPVERGYKACGDELRAALGPRTRAVLFNSPVNPTGTVYSREELQDLFEPLLETDALIVSDEIYERFVYEGEHVSPLQVYPELQERFLIATGASKSFAMTGWRIGFGLGPEPLVRAMINLQSHMTGNPNSVAQRAAIRALQMPDAELEPMRRRFRSRRDACLEVLGRFPSLRFPYPRGTFYVFLDVAPFYGEWQGGRRIENSEQLAAHLVEQHGVAVVPGRAFDHDGGIRLSCTLPEDELRGGLETLVEALRNRS
ncbi:MAG: pyridoxal phosphate-dependent aminotransferase [Candidatus Krumholzibacteriia bacterium]